MSAYFPTRPEWEACTATPDAGSRSAADWAPYRAVLVAAAEPIQIAGPRAGRERIRIANIGDTNNCVLLNSQSQPVAQGFPLEKETEIDLRVEGQIYAYSLAGTELAILETWYRFIPTISKDDGTTVTEVTPVPGLNPLS